MLPDCRNLRQSRPVGRLFGLQDVVASDQLRTRPAKPHLHTNNPQRKQPRQVPKIWQGCLFYLTRNEAIVRAQITNLRQRERSAQLIGFLSVLLAFSSLSLFVVTKRFQKRPDKRNSLRLAASLRQPFVSMEGFVLRFALFD